MPFTIPQLERFHIGPKKKPLQHLCVVAFSDGEPDATFRKMLSAPGSFGAHAADCGIDADGSAAPTVIRP
jgi:hypothetical protein